MNVKLLPKPKASTNPQMLLYTKTALTALTFRRVATKQARFLPLCQSNSSSDEQQPTESTSLKHKYTRRFRTLVSPQQLGLKDLAGTLIVSDAEHKQLVQEAHKQGTLSFGFSAGGCLFPYFIGVASALRDANVLTNTTQLAGASAGSLVSACIKSGMSVDQITDLCLKMMHDLRTNGTRGRLGPVLESFLHTHLPHDAHQRCSNKAHVAVTQAWPYVKAHLISEYTNREDLIGALMTSCHIPYWLDGKGLTTFRGSPHLDGGLTNFIPLPPQTVGIRISCFPSQQLSPVYRIGISPDTFEPWPYTLRQMVGWAFEPADENMLTYLIEKGFKDSTRWMEAMELRGEKEEAVGKKESGVGEVAASQRVAVDSDNGSSEKVDEMLDMGVEELNKRQKIDKEGGGMNEEERIRLLQLGNK